MPSTMTVDARTALLLLLLSTSQISCKRLQLDQHGRFVNFVVSLPENATESYELISSVKATMHDVSSRLATATGALAPSSQSRGMTLGEVRILVPVHWRNQSMIDLPATWEQRRNAHLQMHHHEAADSRGSFTYQDDGCAKPGRFIVMGVKEFKNGTDRGVVSRTLLQRFSELVFGVYREEPMGPHFYQSGNQIKPVTCTDKMQGQFVHNVTGAVCRIDSISDRYNNCEFIPDADQSTQASVMATAAVPSVQHFCRSSLHPNSDLHHDSVSPTVHNKMCAGQSVGGVIMRTDVFKQWLAVAPVPNAVTPPLRILTVRPNPHESMSIVMDVSGSMNFFNGAPLRNLKLAVLQLLMELKDGTVVSLVIFNDKVTVLRKPSKLNDTVREDFMRAVRDMKAGNATAIGGGVAEGMKQLGVTLSDPNESQSGYILLVSDGQENKHINYSLTTATAVAQQTAVTCHTISLGSQTDEGMEKLAQVTGGVSCFAPNSNSSQGSISECINSIIDSRLAGSDVPILLYSSPVQTGFSIPLRVDADANNGGKFTLQAVQLAEIRNRDMKIISPSGRVLDKTSSSAEPNNPVYSRDDSLAFVSLELKGKLEAGIWTVNEDSSSQKSQPRHRRSMMQHASVTSQQSSVSLTVTTKASGQQPVLLNGFINNAAADAVQLNSSTRLIVSAAVTQANVPLRNAQIYATLLSDQGVHAAFYLRDNGADPDAMANDGIHSSLLPLSKITKQQRYTVHISCENPVDRVAIAGEFSVTKIDSGDLQLMPPSAVTDLNVRISDSFDAAQIRWTAVGDRQNEGAAARYELLVARNSEEIRTNSSSVQRIAVKAPSLQSGSPQNTSLTKDELAPFSNATMYFCIQAFSSNGTASKLSNIVSFRFVDPITTTTPGTTTTKQPSTTASDQSTPQCSCLLSTTASLLAAFCGLVAAVCAVVLCIRSFWK